MNIVIEPKEYRLILKVFITLSIVGFYYFGWYKPPVLKGLTIGYVGLLVSFVLILLASKELNRPLQFRVFVYICIFASLLFFLDTINRGRFDLSILINYIKPIILFFSFYSFSKLNGLGCYCLKLISILVSVSLFFTILQYFDFDIAWKIRSFLPYIEDDTVRDQIENRIREPGLAYYSVQLQYQINSFVAVVSIFIIKNKFFKYYIFSLLIITFILNLKSTLIGILIFYFIIMISNIRKIDYFKGVIGFILIALFLLSFPDQIGAWRESIGERVTFLIIGFYIIFQNPFGVANRENELTNAIYALEQYSEYLTYSEYLYKMSFHNIFINLPLETGWIGLVILVSLYSMLYSFYKKYSSTSNYALVGKAFIISNLALVMTHNSGPFTVDPYFWIVNATLMGLIKYQKEKNRANYIN